MEKTSKVLLLDHSNPDNLIALKVTEEQLADLSDYYYYEDITDCEGLYLVIHNDESIVVSKCKGETIEEVKANLIKEIEKELSDAKGCGDDCLEIGDLETLGISWFEGDLDCIDCAEQVVNNILDWMCNSYVDGDSGSEYEFMVIHKDDEVDSYEEIFE